MTEAELEKAIAYHRHEVEVYTAALRHLRQQAQADGEEQCR